MFLEHPYLLFLLSISALLLLFRKPKYYVKISSILYSGIKRAKFDVVSLCGYISCFCLLLAALDICHNGMYVSNTSSKRNYILINDASSSMGQLVVPLIKANESFLSLLKEKNKQDNVGMVVFSNEAFVVSYLVDDLDFISYKINDIAWNQPPLNMGTVVEKAIWTGIQVILKNDNGYLHEQELIDIKNIVKGRGAELDGHASKNILSSINRVSGSCMILFTDGYFNVTTEEDASLSTIKLVDLCAHLGIKVYIIDLMPLSPSIHTQSFLNKLRETGGDMIVTKEDNIGDTYKYILDMESAQTKTLVWQKKSYAEYFAISALTFMLCFYIMRRFLTSV